MKTLPSFDWFLADTRAKLLPQPQPAVGEQAPDVCARFDMLLPGETRNTCREELIFKVAQRLRQYQNLRAHPLHFELRSFRPDSEELELQVVRAAQARQRLAQLEQQFHFSGESRLECLPLTRCPLPPMWTYQKGHLWCTSFRLEPHFWWFRAPPLLSLLLGELRIAARGDLCTPGSFFARHRPLRQLLRRWRPPQLFPRPRTHNWATMKKTHGALEYCRMLEKLESNPERRRLGLPLLQGPLPQPAPTKAPSAPAEWTMHIDRAEDYATSEWTQIYHTTPTAAPPTPGFQAPLTTYQFSVTTDMTPSSSSGGPLPR